jgi:hypothetical protein
MKPVPLMVTAVSLAPARTDDGRSPEMDGTGLLETVTLAEPDFVESWLEVAVMDAVPVAVAVKTPADVIVPRVAVQETAEL